MIGEMTSKVEEKHVQNKNPI